MIPRIGLTFGGYCPMHQGHLDCIMRAKKECTKVFVVVCGYDNEPRGKELGLEYEKRLRLIKDYFKDDEIITVFGVNDTEIGIDESMSFDNWKKWLDYVMINCVYQHRESKVITSDNPIRVYVGEKKYSEDLKLLKDEGYRVEPVTVGLDSEIGMRINAVSATQIRKNPIKYWNKIAEPFKPALTKRILVTGTASEGKTTMVKDLARYFQCPYTTEFGRDYMESRNIKDPDLTFADFVSFALGQNRYYQEALTSPKNNGVIISDTDNLVTLMYAKAYSTNPEMEITKDEYEQLHDLVKRLSKDITWDKIYILPPRNTFVNDGCRYMGQSGMDERRKNFDILLKLIEEFGLMDKVEILYSDFYNNFNHVKEYIQSLYTK